MNKNFYKFFKYVFIIFFLSLGISIVRIVSTPFLVEPIGDLLIHSNSGYTSAFFWLFLTEFSQVLASIGVGIFIGFKKQWPNIKILGLLIVCVSTLLYFLFCQQVNVETKLWNGMYINIQIAIFVLSILAVLLGIKIGKILKK